MRERCHDLSRAHVVRILSLSLSWPFFFLPRSQRRSLFSVARVSSLATRYPSAMRCFFLELGRPLFLRRSGGTRGERKHCSVHPGRRWSNSAAPLLLPLAPTALSRSTAMLLSHCRYCYLASCSPLRLSQVCQLPTTLSNLSSWWRTIVAHGTESRTFACLLSRAPTGPPRTVMKQRPALSDTDYDRLRRNSRGRATTASTPALASQPERRCHVTQQRPHWPDVRPLTVTALSSWHVISRSVRSARRRRDWSRTPYRCRRRSPRRTPRRADRIAAICHTGESRPEVRRALRVRVLSCGVAVSLSRHDRCMSLHATAGSHRQSRSVMAVAPLFAAYYSLYRRDHLPRNGPQTRRRAKLSSSPSSRRVSRTSRQSFDDRCSPQSSRRSV